MSIVQALTSVFSGLDFQAAVALIALDFVLGVIAAWRLGTFRLSYVADFLRNDVAFKLLPWASLAIAAQFAGSQQIVIPGLDLAMIAGAVYVAIVAAWVASILGSLKGAGLPIPDIPGQNSVIADENAAPPKD